MMHPHTASRSTATAGGAGAALAPRSPALGAALCDRLCFAKDAAALLAHSQRREADGSATAVHARHGTLPDWWLLAATSFYLPIQITSGLLAQVLVPADVAAIVGSEDKARYLGYVVTIAMVVQNCQPIFGSVSDKTRSRFGRRRPFIIVGQALSAVALLVMWNAQTFGLYCLGYQLYQLGNCTTFATLCAIQPALQETQRGKYGGFAGASESLGSLGAAVLGLAIGQGLVRHDATYITLLLLQFVLMLLGIASFSSSPGFWQPELDAEEEADAVAAAVGGPEGTGGLLDIAAPFRRPVYRWLFIYYVVNSVNWQIRSTFMQYYLSDVIGPDFSLHLDLPGMSVKHIAIASNPESAISFMNICQQVITMPLAPIGGVLADSYNRPNLVSISVTIASITMAVVVRNNCMINDKSMIMNIADPTAVLVLALNGKNT